MTAGAAKTISTVPSSGQMMNMINDKAPQKSNPLYATKATMDDPIM